MPQRRTANTIKDQGARKPKTRRISDHARPRGVNRPAGRTVTGQGGSPKGGGQPDVAHPSQRGGIKAEERDLRLGAGGAAPRGREPGQKRAGSAGLTKGPSRSRPRGAAAAGGRTRTGRDRDGARGRARGGSRTRGR